MTNQNSSQRQVFIPKINDVAQKFIDDLQNERTRLSDDFPTCSMLIESAIDSVYATGRIPGKELKADIFQQKPMKLTQNVFLPIKQYPKFNFLGKILGPKGNTLKRLHEDTRCSISIKGRTSLRDDNKEELLRQSGNPAYNHLNKNPYIEIATVAPPAEAYSRLAYALTELRKYIIPDKNDEISQEQYRELMEIDPKLFKGKYFPSCQKSHLQKLSLNGTQDLPTTCKDENHDTTLPTTTIDTKMRNLRHHPYQKKIAVEVNKKQ